MTVAYIDTLFVFNEPDSQRVWSVVSQDAITGDFIYPLVFDPLTFASVDGSPDGVVAINVDHRQMWVFGTDSTEVWYDVGGSAFPLSPIQGAFNEIGCVAAFSVAKLDNTLFWLGTDARGQGIVYKANGYAGVRVSTHAIEYAIAQYGNLSNALAYTYQQEGHAFYVLTFPSANATWVYDVSTQAWHERAGFVDGEFTRHRSNCQCNFGGNTLVGDFANGNLYRLNLDVYADNGGIQKWLRSWRALPMGQNNLKRTAQHSLQLDAETGVGLNLYPAYDSENIDTESGLNLVAEYLQRFLTTQSGDTLTTEAGDGFEPLGQFDVPELDTNGYEIVTTAYLAAPGYLPEVMLRWSDDGGHTFSNEHWREMGAIGQYGYRTIWRRLGMTQKIRDRVYEVSGTDPVKIAIMGAELLISPTAS